MDKLEFKAEVKKVQSRKTSSGDMEYQVVLITNNPRILALGSLPAQTYFKVEIAVSS